MTGEPAHKRTMREIPDVVAPSYQDHLDSVLFTIEVRHTIPILRGGKHTPHDAAFLAIAAQKGDGEYRFTLPGADPDTFTKVTVEWECQG